ncbi:MAG: radical SAM family heme chaperone HemW [Bacteroidales bacterium]|nr:radical SAM family heme chaperone HemW [Bacteroidales bacterium]
MAGIYIHIPFCKTICPYCDFYSITDNDGYEMFVDALLKEAVQRREYLGGESVSTVYFGGGTPSVLPVGQLNLILNRLRKLFDVTDNPEITIELNPDDVNIDYLSNLKRAGFTRLSYGVQSWDERILKFLRRRHTTEQSAEAIENAIKAGFENISADLIYGIPGLTNELWSETLDITLGFDLKHISAYHLTIEPGTLFGRLKEAGKLKEADEETSNAQFEILIEKTGKAGFIQYEISNFGKEGWFSQHNSNYWKQISYLGLGPSAHSFNKISRQWNLKSVAKYVKAVNQGKNYFEYEELDSRKRFNEYIITSLRTMWGLDLDFIEQNFEKEGYDYVMNLSSRFINYGLMRKEENRLVLTNQGKVISDNIITEFIMTS